MGPISVCSDQKRDVAHVLGEAHVLKREHVINQPVFLEEISIRIAAAGFFLMEGRKGCW